MEIIIDQIFFDIIKYNPYRDVLIFTSICKKYGKYREDADFWISLAILKYDIDLRLLKIKIDKDKVFRRHTSNKFVNAFYKYKWLEINIDKNPKTDKNIFEDVSGNNYYWYQRLKYKYSVENDVLDELYEIFDCNDIYNKPLVIYSRINLLFISGGCAWENYDNYCIHTNERKYCNASIKIISMILKRGINKNWYTKCENRDNSLKYKDCIDAINLIKIYSSTTAFIAYNLNPLHVIVDNWLNDTDYDKIILLFEAFNPNSDTLRIILEKAMTSLENREIFNIFIDSCLVFCENKISFILSLVEYLPKTILNYIISKSITKSERNIIKDECHMNPDKYRKLYQILFL